MAKQKGAHVSDKAQYTAYASQGRYLTNKKASLERHLKNHPNDVKAAEALKNLSSASIRKTPKSYVWGARQMKYAQQLASLGYNGQIALGGKEEAKYREDVIGYGAAQILDVPPKQRDANKAEAKSSKK